MADDDGELAMVFGHVQLGHAQLRSQRAVIKRLLALGASVELAQDLMANFVAIQRMHREHLRRLRAVPDASRLIGHGW
jgi:hypothetical protein